MTMPPTSSYTPTSPSHFPSSYHPALHYRPSVPSDYLPDDEYRYLVKQEVCSRLEAHFTQPSLSKSRKMRPKTAYQKRGTLNRSHREKISSRAYATRVALGPNFDFTDERFDKMQAARDPPDSLRSSNREENQGEEPVPARYIAECYEELRYVERTYYGHQNQRRSDDSTSSAPRRTHPSAHSDTNSLPPREPTLPCDEVQRRRWHEGRLEDKTAYGPRPQPQTRFVDARPSELGSCASDQQDKKKQNVVSRVRTSKHSAPGE